MNLEEAKANIGKEVVLDESTKPYTFIRHLGGIIKKWSQPNDDQVFTIHNTEEIGNVLVRGTDDHRIHPRHLKLKEQPMNYKIRVTPETSAEVQELFFELGATHGNGENHAVDVPSICGIALVDGLINFIFNEVVFERESFQEITLPQLRDMVVLKRNDVSDATHTYKCDKLRKYYIGHSVYRWNDSCWQEIPLNETYISGWLKLISADTQMTWQDALRAVADGKEVEVTDGEYWVDIAVCCIQDLEDFKGFRLAPQRITLHNSYTKEELLKIAGEME